MMKSTKCALLLALMCVFSVPAGAAEKRAVFYETFGFKRDAVWHVPFLVWTYEEAGTARKLFAKIARRGLRIAGKLDDLSKQQKQIFLARSADMIADSRSGQQVRIVFDKDPAFQVFQLVGHDKARQTDRNGLLEGLLEIPEQTAARLLRAQNSPNGWLTFRTVSASPKGRGSLRLIPPTGLSVISDIDDTIKVTEIPSGKPTVIRNTFFKPFVAAPCMKNRYRMFGAKVPFHYVSGGPWQMYRPLSAFMFGQNSAMGFPGGSFHMKFVRTNLTEADSWRDLSNLLGGSKELTRKQKIKKISQLIGDYFPQRQFILIGDSGELDPEVFAEVKKRFGDRIRDIFIRDVVDARTRTPKRVKGMKIIQPKADAGGRCAVRPG